MCARFRHPDSAGEEGQDRGGRQRWYARVVRRWLLQRKRTFGAGVAGLAVFGLLTGCASPGVPRPPSLHLPALVRDLSALRVGSAVELHFTAPEETTDHLPLTRKGAPVPLVAAICRVQGASCLRVAQFPVAPGEAASAADTLPPALTVGPGRAVAYRVRVENASGRDAGLSREAVAVAGVAPLAITGLAVTTVAQGMQLTWKAEPGEPSPVRVEAMTKSPGASLTASVGTPPARTTQDAIRLLQTPASKRDTGGAIDPAPAPGERVVYHVYRQRDVAVDGKVLPLRGDPATVAAVRSADVFAPAVPLGLLAVAFAAENAGSSVSLSWEANAEPDVAGYYVYRAVGTDAFQRLTPSPITGVSFQDTAATGLRAGTRVRYAVTAIDRAGNESARSAVTETDVR